MERDKCVGYAGAYKETDAAYILIRSNKMQQYAGIYLLQNYSTCFGCPLHPSSGVHKTVTAASGTGHIVYMCNDHPPEWPVGHAGGRSLHRYVI